MGTVIISRQRLVRNAMAPAPKVRPLMPLTTSLFDKGINKFLTLLDNASLKQRLGALQFAILHDPFYIRGLQYYQDDSRPEPQQ
jgi:hypothetical protein